MDARNFLDLILQQFASEITQNKAIKLFSNHATIKGQLAELLVRRLVKQVVAPLHVCTGAVIDEKICSSDKKEHQNHQIDVIIWSPSPMPALFCIEDFGLIPRSSCFGIMEVKSSLYYDGEKKLIQKLQDEAVEKLVSDVYRNEKFKEDLKEDEAKVQDLSTFPALGVVCYKPKGYKLKPELEELKANGKLVIIFDEKEDDKPDPLAVARIINFLIMTKRRAKFAEGKEFINTLHLRKDEIQLFDKDKTGTSKPSPFLPENMKNSTDPNLQGTSTRTY